MDTIDVSKRQRIAEWARPHLKRNRGWILSLLGGFLLGRFTNARDTVDNFAALWSFLFSLETRPLNALTWLSVLILICIPLLSKYLDHLYRKARYESHLARLVESRVDPIASPFSHGVIAWGPDISLQVAPDLREGWPVAEVRVRYSGDVFEIPNRWRLAYDRYYEENKESKRFFDDRDKYMLARNPRAFSDSPTLVLELKRTKSSVVQFYRDIVATVQPERDPLIIAALEDSIRFPHALCMHAVVVTSDQNILLTRRSPKVSYHSGAWSASLEEQLARVDVEPSNEGVTTRWAERFLREELAVERQDYDLRNCRILAVFLEADILNCSLAAVFRLGVTMEELNNIIEAKPRTDYEFSEWKFIRYNDLVVELRHPRHTLHPTSSFRMLLAGLKHFGAPGLARRLFEDSSGVS